MIPEAARNDPDAPWLGDGTSETIVDRADALETEGARRMRQLAEARAIADHPEDDEGGIRTDGGENAHASRVAEQLAMADDDGDERDRLHVGDQVVDRNDPDGATMVVVADPAKSAGGYVIKGRMTVADYDESVDPTEDVYEVVYPDRTTVDVDDLKRYAFARSRLELVAPVHDRDRDGGDD